jgi:hypothetical protein
MNEKKIRVLVVDATDQVTSTIANRLSEVEGIEVVGVAYNRNAALAHRRRLKASPEENSYGWCHLARSRLGFYSEY